MFSDLNEALRDLIENLDECGCAKKKKKRSKKDDIEHDEDGEVLDETEVEEGYELPPCPSCGSTSKKLCCADSIEVAKNMKKDKYRRAKPEKKGAKEVGTGKKVQGKVDQKARNAFAKQVDTYTAARAQTIKDDDA